MTNEIFTPHFLISKVRKMKLKRSKLNETASVQLTVLRMSSTVTNIISFSSMMNRAKAKSILRIHLFYTPKIKYLTMQIKVWRKRESNYSLYSSSDCFFRKNVHRLPMNAKFRIVFQASIS